MGHERSGNLPRSHRWREIVAGLSSAPSTPGEAERIAAATLNNVYERFDQIHRDKGVQAAFAFLLTLATRQEHAKQGLSSSGLDIPSESSPLQLVRFLKGWVQQNAQSLEYAALAQKAGADAISQWVKQQQAQPSLFLTPRQADEAWSRAGTGAAFCQISRFFFASFTERYLNYFLDREASAEASSLGERERLAAALNQRVDSVSRHAFELSRITQSFSAGWFNKNAREGPPTSSQIERFLAIAFGKMREEILRESAA